MKNLLIVALATLSLTAQASDLNYDNVTVYVDQTSADDSDFDSGGAGVSGSISINEQFFVIGGLYRGETDEEFWNYYNFETDVFKVEQVHFGAGMHTPINDKTDFVATVVISKNKFKYLGESESFTNKHIGVGVRHLLDPSFELGAEVAYNMLDDSDNIFSYGGRATYHASEVIAVSFTYSIADHSETTTLAASFKF